MGQMSITGSWKYWAWSFLLLITEFNDILAVVFWSQTVYSVRGMFCRDTLAAKSLERTTNNTTLNTSTLHISHNVSHGSALDLH